LLLQLEPDGAPGLFLPYGRAIDGMAVWRHIFYFEADDIAAAELAVDRQIEHRKVALSPFDLQFGADRPNGLRSERRFCPGGFDGHAALFVRQKQIRWGELGSADRVWAAVPPAGDHIERLDQRL
jgi:hypothetical protein